MSNSLEYIVKSGSGYVFDRKTLEMVGNPANESDAALRAIRMSLLEAIETIDLLSTMGISAEAIEIRLGSPPFLG